MKVTIERVGGGPMTLEQFADKHGLDMIVRERSIDNIKRCKWMGEGSQFYAQFDHADVLEDCCLVGTYGDGKTPEDAIEDYKSRILGKRLAINAFGEDRKEIDVPNEWAPTPQ